MKECIEIPRFVSLGLYTDCFFTSVGFVAVAIFDKTAQILSLECYSGSLITEIHKIHRQYQLLGGCPCNTSQEDCNHIHRCFSNEEEWCQWNTFCIWLKDFNGGGYSVIFKIYTFWTANLLPKQVHSHGTTVNTVNGSSMKCSCCKIKQCKKITWV